MKFYQRLVVEHVDVDDQNHVNNVAYVRWIQNVAVAHWFAVTDEGIRDEYSWIVTRHEIDYLKAAFAGEEMELATWVGDPRRATWERFTEIRRGEELVVRARSVWCLVRRSDMRPTRITDDIIKRLSESLHG
jgi:acyl-CoA thioester hydrolase